MRLCRFPSLDFWPHHWMAFLSTCYQSQFQTEYKWCLFLKSWTWPTQPSILNSHICCFPNHNQHGIHCSNQSCHTPPPFIPQYKYIMVHQFEGYQCTSCQYHRKRHIHHFQSLLNQYKHKYCQWQRRLYNISKFVANKYSTFNSYHITHQDSDITTNSNHCTCTLTNTIALNQQLQKWHKLHHLCCNNTPIYDIRWCISPTMSVGFLIQLSQ